MRVKITVETQAAPSKAVRQAGGFVRAMLRTGKSDQEATPPSKGRRSRRSAVGSTTRSPCSIGVA